MGFCMNSGKYTGLWIDHKKAVIVGFSDKNHVMVKIDSHVEGRFRLSGGYRSSGRFGPQDVASESQKNNRHRHQLHKYYERVISALRDARSIYIIGPGEAKIELEKEIKKNKQLCFKIAKVRAADKITDNQIIAEIRNYFTSIGLLR